MISDQKRKTPIFTRDLIEERLHEQKRIKLQLQLTPCRNYNYPSRPSLCRNCTRRSGPCCFIDLRAFKVEEDSSLTFGPYFPSATGKDPLQAKTHTSFKPQTGTKESKKYIIKYLKPLLKEIIVQELEAVKNTKMLPIRRQFIEGYSHACDKCLTSIFNLHYVCATCSYELCPKCFSNKNWKNCLHTIPHSPDHFLLYKKYSKQSTKEIIVRLFKNPCLTEERRIIKKPPLAPSAFVKAADVSPDGPCVSGDCVDAQPACSALLKVAVRSSGVLKESARLETVNEALDVTCAEMDRPRPAKIRMVMDQGPSYMTKSYHSLSLKEFQAQWAQKKPVVVTDSLAKSKLEWTPEYFTRNYGKEAIEVIDCVSDKAHGTTVEEYFKAFSEPANRKGYARKLGTSQILKVKDWPPTENIAIKFPELYNDFMATVPIPEYASAGGYFNLANRLPKECLPPDLGPKMFISYEAGKTNLHCDMADAVNILHYASHVTARPEKDPPAAAAIWHIFPSERRVELSDWLWKKHKTFLKKWHPIHSQSLFLDEEQLMAFAADTGIRPWVIHQNPGDAVFIPAGCPHQVRNCRGAIKCAVDFLSPENLEMSASITHQFSELPKVDALQLKSTLLFAWKELMDE